MNQDQALSLARSLAKCAGAVLLYKGAKDAAALVNAPAVIEAVAGLIVTLVGLYTSHKTHKTDSGSATANPAQNQTNENVH